MDILSIITAIAGSGILTAVVGFFQNRRINQASAVAAERTTEADYTERILKQADDRVAQALADRDRAFKERDDAYAESKLQRKAKQEWRDKFFAEQAAKHSLELELADTKAMLKEERWHRCEAPACNERKPPRNEAQKEK
jgi:hypothetical protein